METLIINVPDQKSSVVKLLLKELGVTIKSKSKAMQLAEEIDASIKPGPKLTINEIVEEVNAVRTKK
ncbi:MAG TPA: hypothetical protein VHA52_07060 [Candidatus Babeliaceae bacterium]|nr:hypothetical protein [Candidatus Babeliaceae bacterium]